MEHKQFGKIKFEITGDNMVRRDELKFGRMLSRDEVLTILSDRIQDLNHKIEYGRIKNATNEKIKNSQMNSLVYLSQNYLKGLRDKDLEQIKNDLMELKSGNISNDEFEQNIIDRVDKGVDLAEIERIENIIESFGD